MGGRTGVWVVAALLVAGLVARMLAFEVGPSEAAVVTTFGAPGEGVASSGPHMKLPWPLQEVHRVDLRQRVLEGRLEELLTQDRRAVVVSSFLVWRVIDPERYVERVAGSATEVERQLRNALSAATAAAIAGVRFAQLASTEGGLAHTQVEAQIAEDLAPLADAMGVEVQLAGLRRVGLPELATEAVFDRMSRERELRAGRIAAQAEAEAQRARWSADLDQRAAIESAEAEALRGLGEGESEAAAVWSELAPDRQTQELARLLERLDALGALLEGRTTLVLDPRVSPFDVLRDPSVGGR